MHTILDVITLCLDNIAKKSYTGLLHLALTKAFNALNHKFLFLQNILHFSKKT